MRGDSLDPRRVARIIVENSKFAMIGRLVVLVSLVLLVVALSSEAAPTGGALPSSFAANIQLFISASGHATNYYGTVYYDYLKLRRRLTVQDQYSRTIDALSRFDLVRSQQLHR